MPECFCIGFIVTFVVENHINQNQRRMKKYQNMLFLCVLLGTATVSNGMLYACTSGGNEPNPKENEKPDTPPTGGEETDEDIPSKPGVEGTRIAWAGKAIRIGAGTYGRVKALSDGRLMAVFENDGGYYAVSKDEGRSWGSLTCVFPTTTEKGVTIGISNAELIELSTGELLFAVNRRPQKEGLVSFGIAVKRSLDGGQTWSDEQIVYEAGKVFGDGCWEPAFLELPDGTVQIYFANEGSYTRSDEQEISMISSADKGTTWTKKAVKVCFRAGHRDGMPVPALFGNEIVVAIEDNKENWNFKPYTVRTSLSDNWGTYVSGDSPDRFYALKEKMDNADVGSAPYLIRLPTGEALLSYQTTEGRNAQADPMARCTMEVALGDEQAKDFVKIDRPFAFGADQRALWNSLSMLDENTVGAVAEIDHHVQLMKGFLRTDLQALHTSIEVDGTLAQAEWNNAYPLFAGNNDHYAKVNISIDGDRLCIGGRLYFNSFGAVDTNRCGVTLYLDPTNACLEKPGKGTWKVACLLNGKAEVSEGKNGSWKARPAVVPTLQVKEVGGGYYTFECSLSLKALGRATTSDLRIAAGAVTPGGQVMTPFATAEAPYTWCRLKQ